MQVFVERESISFRVTSPKHAFHNTTGNTVLFGLTTFQGEILSLFKHERVKRFDETRIPK